MGSVVKLIYGYRNMFHVFSKVYIFGSSLNDESPNDIDLLLIYKSYSKNIQNEKNMISLFFEKEFLLPIDITILSEKELQETKFLKKLNFSYRRIK